MEHFSISPVELEAANVFSPQRICAIPSGEAVKIAAERSAAKNFFKFILLPSILSAV